MPSEKYITVKGKKYKKSPLKDSEYKKGLVKKLMKARRDVGIAIKEKNKTKEKEARRRVHKFKVLLGERKKWKTN